MRPLFHPSPEDITVEGILHALSDPVRVHIFVQIARSACAQTCSAFLQVSDKPVPKSTLSQHFKVLRDAGLIRSERKGVEMHNSTRGLELPERFASMITAIIVAYTAQAERAQGRKTRRPKKG